MPRFSYKAYDSNGKLCTGEISAVSRGSALEALSRRAQTAVHLTDVGVEAPVPWWQREIGKGRLSTSKLASFTRELSSLVQASLPVDETLRILSMQPMIQARLRHTIRELLRRVVEGEQLSAAIASQGIFPEYYSRLVAAGEVGGSLASVLDQLASFLERSAESRARLWASLAYPCLLLLAAAVVIGVLALVLVPVVLPIFDDAGSAPPLVIRALAGLSAVGLGSWIAFFLGILGLAAVAAYNRKARQALDRIALSLPITGPLVTEREAGRFARTFSMLLGNGVPMLESMRIAASTLLNEVLRDAILSAQVRVKEGEALASALGRSGYLPPLLLRLVAVGEQTGQLDGMVRRAAEIYEGAFQRRVDRLTAMATPVLTLLIGGVVGVLVVSVLSAVLSMNTLVLQ
jgi:general secretion pathway protein F